MPEIELEMGGWVDYSRFASGVGSCGGLLKVWAWFTKVIAGSGEQPLETRIGQSAR